MAAGMSSCHVCTHAIRAGTPWWLLAAAAAATAYCHCCCCSASMLSASPCTGKHRPSEATTLAANHWFNSVLRSHTSQLDLAPPQARHMRITQPPHLRCRKWDGKRGGKQVHRMELPELNTTGDRYYLPLSKCPMDCNHRGRCVKEKANPKPFCL